MSQDIGEGPVHAYRIYFNIQNETMIQRTDTLIPSEVHSAILDYNITGLESGRLYVIQITVIRDGYGRPEGEKGPELLVKTQEPGR